MRTVYEADEIDFEFPDDAAGQTIVAFDRDYTVDVNPHPDYEATVPLDWIRYLAHETEIVVFATGNQTLKTEAEIPGMAEIIHGHPDLDPEGNNGLAQRLLGRREALRRLAEMYPDAQEYIVVDDIDVSDVDGWTHHYPWDFVGAVEDGDQLAAVDVPAIGGE